MRTQTMVVLLAALVFLAFAVYFKDAVRAGGKFRGGEFYIEAADSHR